MSRTLIFVLVSAGLVAVLVSAAAIAWARIPQALPSESRTTQASPSEEVRGVEVPTSVNCGTIPGGATVPVHIPVKNGNAEAIRFTFKTADCGCISAADSLLLGPREQGALKLALTTPDRPGTISRSVVYALSGPGGPEEIKINVVGRVAGPVLDQHVIQFGTVDAGETRTASFRLLNSEEWALSGVRQSLGPTDAIIQRNGEAGRQVASIVVSVEMPDVSGDDIAWAYDLEFKSKDNVSTARTRCVILASIENVMFKQNSLYLGVARKGKGLVVEREFPLRTKDCDPGLIEPRCLEKSLGIVSIISSETGEGSIGIQLVLAPDAKEGMHTFFLARKDRPGEKAPSGKAAKIPVMVLVLP